MANGPSIKTIKKTKNPEDVRQQFMSPAEVASENQRILNRASTASTGNIPKAPQDKATQSQVRKVDNDIEASQRNISGSSTSIDPGLRETNAFSTPFYLKYLTDDPKYFMQLQFYDYEREGAFSDAKLNTIGTIILPMPLNLAEGLSLDVSDMSFGAFGGEAFESIDRLYKAAQSQNANFKDALKNEASRFVGQVVGRDPDLRRLIFRRIVGVTPELRGAIDTITGTTPNPHLGLTFNGVKLRNYTFSWRLSPNNLIESYNIQEIIRTIKANSLPRLSPLKYYLDYPCLVKISLGGAFKDFGNSILFKHCFIDNFTVDYAPNGSHSFFRQTQLPTDYALTLSLIHI